MCVCVPPCVRLFKNLARVLKFHIWVSHQKIADPYILSELSRLVSPCEVMPLYLENYNCLALSPHVKLCPFISKIIETRSFKLGEEPYKQFCFCSNPFILIMLHVRIYVMYKVVK